jgi:hypothetical protein
VVGHETRSIHSLRHHSRPTHDVDAVLTLRLAATPAHCKSQQQLLAVLVWISTRRRGGARSIGCCLLFPSYSCDVLIYTLHISWDLTVFPTAIETITPALGPIFSTCYTRLPYRPHETSLISPLASSYRQQCCPPRLTWAPDLLSPFWPHSSSIRSGSSFLASNACLSLECLSRLVGYETRRCGRV